MSIRQLDKDLIVTYIPNGSSAPVFPAQKVFLTDLVQAHDFFMNMPLSMPLKTYVVDEEEMRIEAIQCYADAVEFFVEDTLEPYVPLDITTTLQSLIKALEAGSYNVGPASLVMGAKLEVEPLDLSGLKWHGYDEGALIKWPSVGCDHERKTYQGFTDTYDYCEKCGAKNI